jgi:hypothetical protein
VRFGMNAKGLVWAAARDGGCQIAIVLIAIYATVGVQ